jgi:hypothetical protein
VRLSIQASGAVNPGLGSDARFAASKKCPAWAGKSEEDGLELRQIINILFLYVKLLFVFLQNNKLFVLMKTNSYNKI